MSEEPQPQRSFWLGNAVLAIAMAMLLFMGHAWETMGIGAMVIWVSLVALGVYLIMQKRGDP